MEDNTTDCYSVGGGRLRSKIEEIAEGIEMGANSKEGLTKMDEASNVKDGVGVQVDEFEAIKKEEASKEIAAWEIESMDE